MNCAQKDANRTQQKYEIESSNPLAWDIQKDVASIRLKIKYFDHIFWQTWQ